MVPLTLVNAFLRGSKFFGPCSILSDFTQVLCHGKLPFVGLTEKVEQELVWKVKSGLIRFQFNQSSLFFCRSIKHSVDIIYHGLYGDFIG